MEGVNHIHIAEVRRCRLIGQIHRVVQRHIPNGEGLKLGIARLYTPLVLMVELAHTHCKLAAAGARRSNHHQFPGGFYVVILAVAFVTDDLCHIIGIAGYLIMVVDLDIHCLQTV